MLNAATTPTAAKIPIGHHCATLRPNPMTQMVGRRADTIGQRAVCCGDASSAAWRICGGFLADLIPREGMQINTEAKQNYA
jgi:hypothetical protein